MTAAPSNTDIDELITLAGSLLHQSDQHALLLYSPQRYGGQSCKSHLSAQRRVEDRLLAQGLNMDLEISLAYEVSNRHGNDNREHWEAGSRSATATSLAAAKVALSHRRLGVQRALNWVAPATSHA